MIRSPENFCSFREKSGQCRNFISWPKNLRGKPNPNPESEMCTDFSRPGEHCGVPIVTRLAVVKVDIDSAS